MELWYQQHSYLTSPAAVQAVEATISQAAAAGYTGVVLWDSSLNDVNVPGWGSEYLQQVTAFAQSKGLKVMPSVFPYGYSNDILNQDPNLAEGQHITGTQFQVNASGTALNVINTFAGLQNAGFESGATAWFSYGDAGVSLDTSTSHSGSASARISNPPANARLVQSFPVTPWRQYHFRIWAKTQNFTNTPSVYISDSTDWNAQRLNISLSTAGTQGWTAYDFTLNSASSTSLTILMGEWGGASGTLWLDDVLFEETGLIYVIRRGGTPLKMYNPANPSVTYNEGTDFNAISDPEVAPGGFGDHWHTPPTVTLPAGSSLRPGQTVALDYYAVVPIYSSQVGMCLTDPGVLTYLQANVNTLAEIFPANSPYLLEYDEMRHLNSCALCKAMNMTAGQLLGWNVEQSLNMFKAATPGSALYFWSDMFDPNMNAHADYYLAEGDISGSWTALPSNATIMNWNLSNLAPSIRFFAGQTAQQPRAFRQVLAGFYDPADDNGANAATTLLQQASGIPGVVGLMYTTWVDNYTQLGNFAAAARAAWPAYQNSVGVSGGNAGSILGVVLDNAGNGISGASISAVLSGNATVNIVSGANGAFEIANLAAGNWTLNVSAPNFTSVSTQVAVSAGTSTPATVTLSSSAFTPIFVNAGGSSYTDPSGNIWSADKDFTGGSTYTGTGSIAGTTTPVLYQSERYNTSTLEYRFAVPNGSYSVDLKFAEVWFGAAGQRTFNIVINGSQVAANFDVFAAAGGPNIAVDKTYSVTATNNLIDIQFVPVISNPAVNAIAIALSGASSAPPAAPPTSSFTPIRTNAGGPAYTDSLGQSWSADAGFEDGASYSSSIAVAGADDPTLYQTERYCAGCTLEYTYQVPDGTYIVNLKFAEIWFNTTGQRVFNILINNQPYEVNFDIVRLAGGADIALDRRYPITVTNGTIDIKLVPVISNPKISAIEITQALAAPVRVNAGGPQLTDPLGRIWSADTGFVNGLTYSTAATVSQTPAPVLYQTERYNTGTLEYKYAVANGTWTVNLKFAEIWYNSAGQRVFNIVINGNQVASSFDPFAASGAANTAIDKQFQTTVTNGVLDIQLVPVVSNPKIGAIEIFR